MGQDLGDAPVVREGRAGQILVGQTADRLGKSPGAGLESAEPGARSPTTVVGVAAEAVVMQSSLAHRGEILQLETT
jgi:hypothetical protein